MRAYLLVASVSLVACGGRVQSEFESSDAAVDTSVRADTALPPKRDSGTPTPRDIGPEPTGCAQRLSPEFTCSAPEPRAGKTVCNDVMIRALVEGCFGETATESSCSSARTKYPTCSSCMLSDWLVEGTRLAVAQCMQKIDPKNSCVTSVECTYDCLDEVCIDCDPFTGELDDCWSNEAEGQCAKHSAEYTACVSDPKFSVCFPNTIEDVIPFYRGACRDGGNWSRAYEADGVDAGAGDI